jgi:hypothetical protein
MLIIILTIWTKDRINVRIFRRIHPKYVTNTNCVNALIKNLSIFFVQRSKGLIINNAFSSNRNILHDSSYIFWRNLTYTLGYRVLTCVNHVQGQWFSALHGMPQKSRNRVTNAESITDTAELSQVIIKKIFLKYNLYICTRTYIRILPVKKSQVMEFTSVRLK